ncbi:MAG: hypothetical protein WCV63_11225, partial [Negativicutes bacterium]
MSCESKKQKYAEFNNAVNEYNLALAQAGFEDKVVVIVMRAMQRAIALFGKSKTWTREFKSFCQAFMTGYENVQKLSDIMDQTDVGKAYDAYINEKCDPTCTAKDCDACGKHSGPKPDEPSPDDDDAWKRILALAPLRRDPIALDLDGDGVEFIKNGAYFDYDNNKFAEKATWIGKDDGWLALDKNGDGKIGDGSELFGEAMRKKDGTLAKDGFDALAEYDDNKDGKIDSSDAIYSQLRVWQDANGNGVTDAGELKSLTELGIKQLNLQKTAVNGTVQPNGETITNKSSFVWENGASGQLNSYFVQRSMTDTQETELLPVPDDVKALPDVRGWGSLHSLQQAMVRDSSGKLKELVGQFINADGKTVKEQLAEQILIAWCDASGIVVSSRGGNVDARKLAVLERLYGETFNGVGGTNPNNVAGPELTKMFDKFAEKFCCSMLVQSTALLFVMQTTADAKGNITGYNLEYAKQMLDGIIAIDQTAGLELLGNYWRVVKAYGYADATNSDYQKYLDFYNNYSAKGGEYQEALYIYSL